MEEALEKDTFFNPNKRAKLVRRACDALAGYCREHDLQPTGELQAKLSDILISRAPNSLSDPTHISKDPSVSAIGSLVYMVEMLSGDLHTIVKNCALR